MDEQQDERRPFTARDVEGDSPPEKPNIFYTGQMIHRAIGLCGGLTTDGRGAVACRHSNECGLPKMLNAIRNKIGKDRDELLAIATPELIAATIGTENDFPPPEVTPPEEKHVDMESSDADDRPSVGSQEHES